MHLVVFFLILYFGYLMKIEEMLQFNLFSTLLLYCEREGSNFIELRTVEINCHLNPVVNKNTYRRARNMKGEFGNSKKSLASKNLNFCKYNNKYYYNNYN